MIVKVVSDEEEEVEKAKPKKKKRRKLRLKEIRRASLGEYNSSDYVDVTDTDSVKMVIGGFASFLWKERWHRKSCIP